MKFEKGHQPIAGVCQVPISWNFDHLQSCEEPSPLLAQTQFNQLIILLTSFDKLQH